MRPLFLILLIGCATSQRAPEPTTPKPPPVAPAPHAPLPQPNPEPAAMPPPPQAGPPPAPFVGPSRRELLAELKNAEPGYERFLGHGAPRALIQVTWEGRWTLSPLVPDQAAMDAAQAAAKAQGQGWTPEQEFGYLRPGPPQIDEATSAAFLAKFQSLPWEF